MDYLLLSADGMERIEGRKRMKEELEGPDQGQSKDQPVHIPQTRILTTSGEFVWGLKKFSPLYIVNRPP